jgi:hypothetical protein
VRMQLATGLAGWRGKVVQGLSAVPVCADLRIPSKGPRTATAGGARVGKGRHASAAGGTPGRHRHQPVVVLESRIQGRGEAVVAMTMTCVLVLASALAIGAGR